MMMRWFFVSSRSKINVIYPTVTNKSVTFRSVRTDLRSVFEVALVSLKVQLMNVFHPDALPQPQKQQELFPLTKTEQTDVCGEQASV